MPVTGVSAGELRAAYDELYARYTLQESADYYLWVCGLLALQSGEVLADIGCGAGLLLKALASQGMSRVVGIDFSEHALQLARQAGRPPAVCVAEAEHVPLPTSSFDCVTCLGSLEHFGDPHAALDEMARLVRPTGRLLIVVPNSYFVLDVLNAWWRGVGPNHGQPLERFAALKDWQALLEQHGLEITRIAKHNNTGVFSKRVFRWLWRLARPFVSMPMSYQFAFLCRPQA